MPKSTVLSAYLDCIEFMGGAKSDPAGVRINCGDEWRARHLRRRCYSARVAERVKNGKERNISESSFDTLEFTIVGPYLVIKDHMYAPYVMEYLSDTGPMPEMPPLPPEPLPVEIKLYPDEPPAIGPNTKLFED